MLNDKKKASSRTRFAFHSTPAKIQPLRSLLLTLMAVVATTGYGHEGPDPVAHWKFDKESVKGNQLLARLGPDGSISGSNILQQDAGVSFLRFRGPNAGVFVCDAATARKFLPKKAITVAAWVSVSRSQDWGGIAGIFQDNGGIEKGWLLGYGKDSFYFGLSTKKADDGDGLLTYLNGKTKFELGKLYHVVGIYDGQEMQLFVNGRLDAASSEQGGDILYPAEGELVLASYRDKNENFPLDGRLGDIAIYDQAATEQWVRRAFERAKRLVELPPSLGVQQGDLRFVVAPYLQYVTQDAITIMWRTNTPASGSVRYGETADVPQRSKSSQSSEIHEIRIEGLQPNTQYFYEAHAETEAGYVASESLTFQTACDEKTPYAFAIISDTQDNPKVAKQISQMAWAQRPSFVIHPGDLVGIGGLATDWTREFFPSMNPLISRVCLFPVLGNHEGDAKFYYDYMSLPDPEYYYSFRYGNAEFFMVDSNRKLSPGSPQYKWLDEKLAASQAEWKFVTHHHPPYSSDENDYGDLWRTNKSTRGDLRLRKTCELYDRYGVDIVWNGHIHSYERTWPLKAHATVADSNEQGTIYMITGGGGGGLETPGPYRTFFQNNVRRGHHYCMAYVNGNTLELKAFDLEGRLFDQVKIVKSQ